MGYEVDDIIQVTLAQDHLNQTVLNVLDYQIVTFGLSADIDTLLDAIETILVDFMLPLQVSSLTHQKIRIDNLTDGITFNEKVISKAGAISPPTMPSYVAGSFSKAVGSKLTRPGGLRLAGIPEADVTGNDWLPNATAQQFLADNLAALITNGLSLQSKIDITPVIARLLTPAPNATFLINPVLSGASRALITTQNTRKQGQGI